LRYAMDLHFHSWYSDGKLMPAEMVTSARRDNGDVSCLAMSDHNTYGRCQEFLGGCKRNGIEGFVSAEISGSHPDNPTEFHFLTSFGPKWDDQTAERANHFAPYFNKLSRVDIQNIFLFLEAAAQLDTRIAYRDVARKSVEWFHSLPEPKSQALIQPTAFRHLRELLRERGLEEGTSGGRTSLEKQVWQRAGVRPQPTPSITEAYAIFRQTRPAVILAHPMLYGATPEQLAPLVCEWQQEIGLIGLEAHYRGSLYPEWKALADELGLLVSAGSDNHGPGYTGEDGGSRVPVIEGGQADVPALMAALRAAG